MLSENRKYLTYLSLVFALTVIFGYFTVSGLSSKEFTNTDFKTINFKGIQEIPCDRVDNLKQIKLPSDTPDSNQSIKIVALGDSFTEGGYSSVSKNETYTTLLEDMLNHDSERRYEVLKFARGGFTMNLKVRTFKEKVDFEPDIIVLQYWPGDYWNYERLRSDFMDSLKKYCEGHDVIPKDQVIKFHRSAYIEEKKNIQKNKTRQMNSNLLEPMRKLDELAGDAKIIFLTVSPPDEPITRKERMARELAESLGWEIIDMRKIYEKYPLRKIKVSENDPHATKFAQKLIAERVLPEIENITEYGRETLE